MIIDLYQVLQGQKELFWDGVHPNKEGSNIIANVVYNYLLR